MIYCPQCGNPNFDDANFCDTCGEPLVRREVYEQMQAQAEAARQVAEQLRQKQANAYNKAYEKAKRDADRAAKSAGAGAGTTAGAAGAGAPVGVATGAPAGVDSAASAAGASPDASPYSEARAHEAAQAGGQSAAAGNGAATTADAAAAAAATATAAATAAAADPSTQPQASFVVYKHGCVAQAWDDITESKGWGKKAFLLGLINMVPVLNFFVSGYAMDWARQLEEDKVEPMPQKLFGEGYFKQGFFAFVLNLVWSMACLVAIAVVDVVPLLGWLLALAFGILATSFSTLSVMRTAISRGLSAGFDVKDIWNALFKADFGKALGATIAPKLIIEAIGLFICISILVIFGLASLTSISQLSSAASMGFASSYYTSIILELLISLIPLLLVCYMVVMFSKALGLVWSMRATSHYVMRCCPQWRTLVQGKQR